MAVAGRESRRGRWALTIAVALLAAVAAAARAFADHPGPGGGRPPGNPVLEALLWAGAAFLVGIAIVAVVAVLARKGKPSQ